MEDIQTYENRLGEYETRYGVLEEEQVTDEEAEKLREELELKEKELNEVKSHFKNEFDSLDKLYRKKVDHLSERVHIIEEQKMNPKPLRQPVPVSKPKKLPVYMNPRSVSITGKTAIDRRKQYGNSLYTHNANLSKITLSKAYGVNKYVNGKRSTSINVVQRTSYNSYPLRKKSEINKVTSSKYKVNSHW